MRRKVLIKSIGILEPRCTICMLILFLLLAPFEAFAEGRTTRVSVSSTGVQGDSISGSPSISSNGRFVAFSSYADNLVAGGSIAYENVFLHDLQTVQTKLVSVSSIGQQGNDWSSSPSISSDGRFVAFQSHADNLVAGDTNGTRDIFVHDRPSGSSGHNLSCVPLLLLGD